MDHSTVDWHHAVHHRHPSETADEGVQDLPFRPSALRARPTRGCSGDGNGAGDEAARQRLRAGNRDWHSRQLRRGADAPSSSRSPAVRHSAGTNRAPLPRTVPSRQSACSPRQGCWPARSLRGAPPGFAPTWPFGRRERRLTWVPHAAPSSQEGSAASGMDGSVDQTFATWNHVASWIGASRRCVPPLMHSARYSGCLWHDAPPDRQERDSNVPSPRPRMERVCAGRSRAADVSEDPLVRARPHAHRAGLRHRHPVCDGPGQRARGPRMRGRARASAGAARRVGRSGTPRGGVVTPSDVANDVDR